MLIRVMLCFLGKVVGASRGIAVTKNLGCNSWPCSANYFPNANLSFIMDLIRVTHNVTASWSFIPDSLELHNQWQQCGTQEDGKRQKSFLHFKLFLFLAYLKGSNTRQVSITYLMRKDDSIMIYSINKKKW